jgi:energy-coupling factor transporter ATP-binding protein EcfA2
MKSITNIQFVNYKAFFSNTEHNNIDIPLGKNVLIYGENGSGKSSIYEGVKQFFNSSDNTIEVLPSRHIKVPKTFTDNTDPANPTEIQNEVAVKITFSEQNGNVEQKIFGVPAESVKGTNYISSANLLNSFLSYRELLRTYLMDDLKDKDEFRKKFAFLLFENVLAKNKNSATQKSYIQSWNDLFLPRMWYKEENLQKFMEGANYDISKINLVLGEILQYFDPALQVELKVTNAEIEYHHSEREGRQGKYPIVGIDLGVKLFGEDVENDEENHLTVLNEARLSSLAIAIYLAMLINTPQDNFDFKILFLDDIFIGLDMGNRKPLLEVLTRFRKPIISQRVDEGTGKIVEEIQKVDGIVQYEPTPFFAGYQIFVSTYDRYWFSVAKSYFETYAKDKWHYIEVFANIVNPNNFNTPIVYNSLDYYKRAILHFKKHDYPSCANHLRKAVESKIKQLLPSNLHYSEQQDLETGVTEIRKLKTLSQYMDRFIGFCDDNGIEATEISELKNLKDWYFNPFSHDNIGTPIYKRELERAIIVTEALLKVDFPIIAEAGTQLFFRFDDGAGQTREYKVELQENLRCISSQGVKFITNPVINCIEWTRNGTPMQVTTWNNIKLFHFYNNKWRALLKQEGIPDAPLQDYWDKLCLVNDSQPLRSKLV